MGKMRQPLAEKILENSEAKTLRAALTEWTTIAKIHNEIDGSIRCLCGQPGIKDWYELKNQRNGKVLIHIGANCITYFTSATDYLPAQHLKKLGQLKQTAQGTNLPTFSQRHFPKGLIDYLWQNDVFVERSENGFHAYRDYQRFSELVYKGGRRAAHSPEEYAELTALWTQYIKPFLLGQPRAELHIQEITPSKVQLMAQLRALEAENARLKAQLASYQQPSEQANNRNHSQQLEQNQAGYALPEAQNKQNRATQPKPETSQPAPTAPQAPSSYAALQKISRRRKNKRDLRPSDLNEELLTYLTARSFLQSKELPLLRQAMKSKNYALNDYLRQPVQRLLKDLTLRIRQDR